MWYDGLFTSLEKLRDPERAVQMAAYMRNKFPFLGISAAPRKKAYHSYLKQAVKEKSIDFEFVKRCFDMKEREYHYAGADYLLAIKELLKPDDLPVIKEFIQTKSWWDTVDILDGAAGAIVQCYPEAKQVMIEWSQDSNLWVRRAAIDHQLLFKEKTDSALLTVIIKNNLGSKEFFINKAIGWSLRDYSKTNPAWVADFIQIHRNHLAPLSIREGSKYIRHYFD